MTDEKKEKNGMVVAFISDGMVSVKWMMRLNELNHGVPSGMFWKHVWYEGKDYINKGGYAKARDIVVQQAMDMNVRFLFFIDSVPGYTPIQVRYADKSIDYIPIEELTNFNNSICDARGVEYEKPNQIIEVRDSYDKWVKVKKIIKHPYEGKLLRINTKGGLVDISPNHSVFKLGKNKPIDAKDLKVGDKLAMPRISPIYKKTVFQGNKDFAWLLGLFVADGSTSNRDFSFTGKKETVIKCKKLLKKNFSTFKASYNISSTKGCYRLGCSALGLKNFFDEKCYTKRHKKKVPKEILNAPLEIKKAFMDGFHEGDGNHSKGKEYVSFTKDSQTLFSGLLYLLESLNKSSYNINIRDDKKSVITVTLNKHTTKWQKKDRTEIKKIMDFDYKGDLYDLSTETERFCGGIGNILLHNTDVFPPTDVITKLLSHNKPIVTGIYYMKSSPAQPVIFKKMGDGPYWDFPVEQLVEIEGSGLGCSMINMEVFDKFKEKSIPFFQEDWEHKKDDGSIVRVKVGEDHWFFMKAKELGFQTYCDTSVLCDHVDVKNGISFPGEEEVKKIREKVLKKHGRKDIIETEKKLFNIDPEKKTIVFYNMTLSDFAGDTIERKAIGGSEGDIINLAKMFAKKYNVFVFCNCTKPGIYDNVHYLHVKDTDCMQGWKTDLFISSRNTLILADVDFKQRFKVDKVCLWTHDLPESYLFDKLPQAIKHKNVDRVFALTQWHQDEIKKVYPMVPEEMWFFARNGVDTQYYKQEVKRNPFKLIYSSTPFRGLDVLLEVFPTIKNLVPEAELHIFSSMLVYGQGDKTETDDFKALYKKAEEMEGVTYHGSVIRRELAKEMKSSAILAYPNHYPETCCITAMESVTAGTPIVTSNKAALPEIIPKGCAILIDGDSHSKEYKEKFIDSIVGILKNPPLWDEMHKACKGHDFTWETISKEWIKEFFPDDTEAYTKILDSDATSKLIDQGIGCEVVGEESNDDKSFNTKKGNINTPEYWNNQYKFENEKGVDQRSDPRRWNIILDNIKDGDVILDYGCATGDFLIYTKSQKANCKLYGLDFSDYAIKIALEKESTLRVSSDIKGFPDDIRENYFDVITSQHVIEHMDDPVEHVEMLRKMLSPEGTLILVIPVNDDEWCEHQMIWQLSDVLDLLGRFDCTYNIVHRKKALRLKKTGKPVEEVIAIIKFK